MPTENHCSQGFFATHAPSGSVPEARCAATADPCKVSFRTKRIYAATVDTGDAAQWSRLLRSLGASEVRDRLDADVYIVDDITTPGQRIKWCSFLAARPICTLEYLRSDGENGSTLQYKGALKMRKSVWCSDGFKMRHQDIYIIIRVLAQLDSSNWKFEDDRASFLRLAQQRTARKRGQEIIAFLLASELSHKDPFFYCMSLLLTVQNALQQDGVKACVATTGRLRRPVVCICVCPARL